MYILKLKVVLLYYCKLHITNHAFSRAFPCSAPNPARELQCSPDPLADGRGSLPLTNYPIPALGLRSQFLGLARPSCAVQSKTLTGNGTQVGLHHWRIKAWAGRASGDPHRPKVGAVVITARSSLPRTRGQAASYHLNR